MIANTPVADAHAYIDAHWPAHLERVRAFLRQRSISAQNDGVRACAELLRAWLEQHGAAVTLHGNPYMPIVQAEWQVGAPKTLLLYGMYDVQPVDDQVWSVPPFAAEIRDHPYGGPSILARGACNSKGPLIAGVNAIEAMRACGGLPLNVKWVIEGEEEIGSLALEPFYREHRAELAADAAFELFWSQSRPGATPQLTLGTKGVIGLEFLCRSGAWGGSTHVRHSSDGAWLASAPWRLVQALATLVNSYQELTVDGLPAHGPMDADDETLLHKMAETFDEAGWLEYFGAARFKHPGMTPFELLRQIQFAPMLNINGLASGYAGQGSHTILPDSARALCDLRLPVGIPVQFAVDALRKHLDARGFDDIEIVVGSGYGGARASYSAPVVQAVLAAYRAHGFEPEVRLIEPSATPYYLFTDVLGISFAWGGLGSAGGSHGPDEWASVEGIRALEKFCVTFFHAFAHASARASAHASAHASARQ